MAIIQDLVHKLEVGGGMRYFRVALSVLALAIVIVAYNFHDYRNMGTQEAMDSAQLARNIARGKGFSTLFIRPFSIGLVRRHNIDRHGQPALGTNPDYAEIKKPHPDLANAPLYPLME